MTRFAALIAALSLAGPALAAKPCLSPAEVDAVMTVALPGIVQGISERCAATLPSDAFLVTRGEALAERYRREGAGAWPAARAVLGRLGGDILSEGILSGMGEAGQRVAVDGIVGAAIAERLSEDRCDAADAMLELLEPLPTASIGKIATVIFALAAEDGGMDRLPFRLCDERGL